MTRFFFYGCWNNDNCNKQCSSECQCPTHYHRSLDHRLMVLQALREDKKSYNFGVIAGDNIYPNKTKNSKLYLESTIKTGIEGFTKSKLKHVIVGNHDIKNPDVLEVEREAFSLDKKFMFHDEIATYKNINNNNFVFLNTNYFSRANTMLVDHKMKVVNAALNEATLSKTIFVVGHEPLVAVKEKKTKIFTEMDDTPALLDLFFSKIAKGYKIIYLCADVHNFQTLSLTYNGMELPVIVVGTGGAEPDLCLFKNAHLLNTPQIMHIGSKQYVATLTSIGKPYGYAIVEKRRGIPLTVTYKYLAGHMAKTGDDIAYTPPPSSNHPLIKSTPIYGIPEIKIKCQVLGEYKVGGCSFCGKAKAKAKKEKTSRKPILQKR